MINLSFFYVRWMSNMPTYPISTCLHVKSLYCLHIPLTPRKVKNLPKITSRNQERIFHDFQHKLEFWRVANILFDFDLNGLIMFEFNYLLVWLEKKIHKLLSFYAQDTVVIFINNIIQWLFNSQIQYLEHSLYM
jgi:hypothetical protein